MLLPSKQYAVVCEIGEITLVNGDTLTLSLVDMYEDSATRSQFGESWALTLQQASAEKTYVAIKRTESDLTKSKSMLRSYVAFPAGTSGSVKLRVSILEDPSVTAETFEYEPYRDLGGGVAAPSSAIYGTSGAEDVISVDDKGGVVVTHRTAVYALDGTENFGQVGSAYYTSGTLDGLKQLEGFATVANMTCSHASVKAPSSLTAAGNIGVGIGNGSNLSLYLNLGSQYATVADFKAYLAAQYAAGTPVTIVYELAEPVTETLAPITPVGTPKDTIHIAADSTHLHAALTCSGWETVSDTSGMSQEMVVMRSTIQQLVDEIALKVAKGDLETYLKLMQEGVYIGKSDSIYRVFIDDAGMHVQQYGEDIAVFAKRTLITPYIRVGPPDSPSGLAISKASDGGMMITNLGVIV